MQTIRNNVKQQNQGKELHLIDKNKIQKIYTANDGELDLSESQITNSKQSATQNNIKNRLINGQIVKRTQQEKQISSININSKVQCLQNNNQTCNENLVKPFVAETHSKQVNSSNQQYNSISDRKLNTNIQKNRQPCFSQKSQQAIISKQQKKESLKMINTTQPYKLNTLNDLTNLSDSQQSKLWTRNDNLNLQSLKFQVGIQMKAQQYRNPTEKEIHQQNVSRQKQKQKVQQVYMNNQKTAILNKQQIPEQQIQKQQQQIPRLNQKQKQQRFQKRLQQERLQKFQLKLQQQKIKANKYFNKMLKDPRIQRTIKGLPAKFKQLPKIADLLLLDINIDLINEISLCQTYDCQFLAFLIPCMYLLASTLNFYEYESSKNLSFYFVFTQLINKIKKIKNKNNAQLTEQELLDHLVIFANYRKYTPYELNSMIGDFIKKHSLRMRGFMPAYYDIFYFHSFQKYPFVDSLQGIAEIRQKRLKISERLDQLWAQIRKKYHSQNI